MCSFTYLFCPHCQTKFCWANFLVSREEKSVKILQSHLILNGKANESGRFFILERMDTTRAFSISRLEMNKRSSIRVTSSYV